MHFFITYLAEMHIPYCTTISLFVGQIQHYFGETVAMYFSFLGFYTMALIPPALIGLLSAFYDSVNTYIFFSIFNLVWATVFLEAWKRNCSALAYSWGTIDSIPFEEARAAYYGELDINKVTGRLEPHYPKWKRVAKYYLVSLPLLLICLWIAFIVMLIYFWLQAKAEKYYAEKSNFGAMIVLYLPSTVYAIVISIMNTIYRKLAKALNDWGMYI